MKIYLYYTIVSNEVLEFLDEFLAAGCLDEQGTDMFVEIYVFENWRDSHSLGKILGRSTE